MCRIKFKETFKMNVGFPDLFKKSYLRKSVLLKKAIIEKPYFREKKRETKIHLFLERSGRPTFILKIS